MRASAADTLPLWPDLEIDRPPVPVIELDAKAIVGLYRSEAHNYFGHNGQAPGQAPMLAEARLNLIAGAGIVGDRFFEYKKGYGGQVTFFAEEVWTRLGEELGRQDRGPDVFRRNVLTRGVDLMSLVGHPFTVQGVRFYGVAHCKPCYWMDRAFAPGSLEKLHTWEAGGLRAKVLTDGWLTVSDQKEASCSAS